MTTYQLQANERHFNVAKTAIAEGGYYVWLDAGEQYQIIKQKFVPMTERGYALLKGIVSPEWFKKNVIFKLN
jgi:hypothetical protein